MATLKNTPFPAGQSVGAYPRSAWLTGSPPSGAPSGAALETQTVAADLSLTFSALADGIYFAYANVGGEHRIVQFTQIAPAGAALGELKRKLWLPAGAIDETVPLRLASGGQQGLVSGTLLLVGGVVIPANRSVSSITFRSGSTAAVTPTNQWFCAVRLSDLLVLAKTVDDTTAAWGGSTNKTLALAGGAYTPTVDTPVYLGVVVAAATPPNLIGVAGSSTLNGVAPALAGTSTAALTNPASLGANAAALTAISAAPYAFIS